MERCNADAGDCAVYGAGASLCIVIGTQNRETFVIVVFIVIIGGAVQGGIFCLKTVKGFQTLFSGVSGAELVFRDLFPVKRVCGISDSGKELPFILIVSERAVE